MLAADSTLCEARLRPGVRDGSVMKAARAAIC
jgi:hypothetical protein